MSEHTDKCCKDIHLSETLVELAKCDPPRGFFSLIDYIQCWIDGEKIVIPEGATFPDLTIEGNVLKLGDSEVDLSAFLDDKDEQTITELRLSGSTLIISLSNGNTRSVNLSAINTNTDNQQLSLSGTSLSIQRGNTVSLAGILNGSAHYQDNTGSYIPLSLVDPITPPSSTAIEGDFTLQEYDNGYVMSIYQSGTWINKRLRSKTKPTKRIVANYLVDYDEDGLILVDASANDVVVTLPLASSREDDENPLVDIKVVDTNSDTYSVFLRPTGADLIEGVNADWQLSMLEAASPKAEPANSSWWLR